MMFQLPSSIMHRATAELEASGLAERAKKTGELIDGTHFG
jgi:hypothetical protein